MNDDVYISINCQLLNCAVWQSVNNITQFFGRATIHASAAKWPWGDFWKMLKCWPEIVTF